MDLIPNPLIIPVGAVIGILVAAPVGPVNVLCIQRALERGFWGGVAAGLGAVLGDGLIALFASLGVGAISGAVEAHRDAIQVIGGIALFIFGLKLYLARPEIVALSPADAERASLKDFIWDIPQTFFLTITNPGAVLGVFGILGVVSTTLVSVERNIDALVMVASIMGGSLAWWVVLSQLISQVRHRFDAASLAKINRGAAWILFLFSAMLVGEMVAQYFGIPMPKIFGYF